jgi:branched-chain amino acid transport system ATP-binding protein
VAAILTIEGVTKAFGSLVAVDHVDLEIAAGSIVGIAGPNGAGKTTLFNVISGVPSGPDSGRIVFDGSAIESLPGHEICRRGLARTFQKEAVFETLTVAQNVRVGAANAGRRRGSRSIDEVVEQRLRAFDLLSYRDSAARVLPLFARKRMMIASAMATDPTVLLLDEPASGLNAGELVEMEAIIRRVNEMGTTVVLIEHVLPLLLAVSQRAMIMDHGRRLVEGTPAEVVSDPRVVEAYLGEQWGRTHGALAH